VGEDLVYEVADLTIEMLDLRYGGSGQIYTLMM